MNVGLGCRFLNMGYGETEEFQSIGAFSIAIYDPQTRGDNHFLGCVNLSQYWQEETSFDMGFTMIRVASAFMLAFTILATVICICLQCFSKAGKSHLWGIMRFCYVGAALSQAAMYSVFASSMCRSEGEELSFYDAFITSNLGERKCLPGTTGILGVINFLLLFGMVIATFNSLPPRNPVFQCWGDMEYDSDTSHDGSTSEEDSVMRKFKSLKDKDDESVSLFGGSRMSKRSRKSMKSMSGELNDDAVSAAEMGLASMSTGSKSWNSQRSKNTNASKLTKSVIPEEGSVKSSSSNKKSISDENDVADVVVAEGASGEIIVETVDSASVTTAKSNQSKSKFLLPGIAKLLGIKTSAEDNESLSSKRSSKVSNELTTSNEAELQAKISASGSLLDVDFDNLTINSSASGSTAEVTNFVLQLIAMTELKSGGKRVKLADVDNKVEIVDEYPKTVGEEIESSPSSDVAAVRTEFYDLGSRTIKDITHKDGSKTIVTTIIVENGDNSTTATPHEKSKPLEPVQMGHSAASIVSMNISKYQVMGNNSSMTSYKGTGKPKQVLEQGDLCLSVGNSMKSSSK